MGTLLQSDIYINIHAWVNKYTTQLTGFSIQSILILNYAIPGVGAAASGAHCSTPAKS